MAMLSGVLISFLLGLVALVLGTQFPVLGSNLIAILLGIVLNNLIGIRPAWEKGLSYAGKHFLQMSIVAMGFTFSIREVSEVGFSSLKLSIITIGIAFVTAYLLGRRLRLRQVLSLLIGFGTAICGGSAIAAASPILEADEEDIALSMSTIFFFNILAVFIFPFLGHLMQMSNVDFGLWAGTAINDTSSVVAAAYTYGQEAGDYATIVKLARALMIVPACLLMVLVKLYRSRQDSVKLSVRQIFPWFILWFLLASVISSFGLVPTVWFSTIKKLSHLLMAMALVGIGSKVSFASFKKAGLSPLSLGLWTWVSVALSSLILQYFWF